MVIYEGLLKSLLYMIHNDGQVTSSKGRYVNGDTVADIKNINKPSFLFLDSDFINDVFKVD